MLFSGVPVRFIIGREAGNVKTVVPVQSAPLPCSRALSRGDNRGMDKTPAGSVGAREIDESTRTQMEMTWQSAA
jgi:hypothetical protein